MEQRSLFESETASLRPHARPQSKLPFELLFERIYVQRKIFDDPEWKARATEILDRYSDVEVLEVDRHDRIQELANADPKRWIQSKRGVLILGVKSTLRMLDNGRSADFIAPSISNGCLSSCQYCYVARHKGGANPLSIFVNVREIADAIERHSEKLGPKLEPAQTDPEFWIYDIGCNADLSLDAAICDHPAYMIERFSRMKRAKATFATKTVNEDYWLSVDPRGRTRIRYSIMPQWISRQVDIRTSPVSDRIRSVNRLVDGGYEVHLNFSPIILYESDRWKRDWIETFREIDETLHARAKKQLACEAFFLTHSAATHEVNLQWNPKGEALLWSPGHQVAKTGKPDVLVYDLATRREAQRWFLETLQRELPYCRVRYIF